MPYRLMKYLDFLSPFKPMLAWVGAKIAIKPILGWIGVTVAITTNILQGLSFLAIACYTFYKWYLLYKENNK